MRLSDKSKSEKQNENIAVNVIGYERVSSRPGRGLDFYHIRIDSKAKEWEIFLSHALTSPSPQYKF